MLTAKRHALIIEQLHKQASVTIQELVNLMDASESTIRRDLSELEKKDLLKRVHGGAMRINDTHAEPSYQEKVGQQTREKQKIAQVAADQLNDFDVIYLDAGTTTHAMIPYLKDRNITVITNGLMHLPELERYQIRTYLIGGQVKHKTGAIVGTVALKQLNAYHFDASFIGTNAIDERFGYSTPDPEEAEIKHKALLQGKRRFILADETKLNTKSSYQIATLNEATFIVDKLSKSMRTRLEKQTTVKVAKS
ncbi:DeoR family transcriptional regulator [Streptohalobacillus salinus]|uniref:DeoR family transcriptional regulator n=1 Tax=Streptohalobacillus salinus TaxID=621096 RepID=A0A2V3WGU8_9BACI|nr:DeoR/GlpR family DNA-binding transcription regulator [Streptohalobacillus salinus]PXW93079.1 DeoR family transcriptional regulator [Streptohalobacillus salinus]